MEHTHNGTLKAIKQKEVRPLVGKWLQLKWPASEKQIRYVIPHMWITKLLQVQSYRYRWYGSGRKQTDWGINRAKGGGGKWERLSRGYVACSKYPAHSMDILHDSDLGTIKNSQAKMFSLKYWLRYKGSLLDVRVWMVKGQWLSGQTEQPKSVVMFAVFYDSRKDMCMTCVLLS